MVPSRFRKTGRDNTSGMLVRCLPFASGPTGPSLAYVSAAPFFGEPATLRASTFKGGHQVYPEFAALLVGLSVYTASYIAEIVRAGI